ncbi:MAG: peptidoglycan-binding domain-containing protein [Chloroflexales bacterium]
MADLQGRLNASGQNVGPPDGFFGDQTRAALRQFQVSRGIPPGDSLDCATWQALLGN